jgi:hypothetical protein
MPKNNKFQAEYYQFFSLKKSISPIPLANLGGLPKVSGKIIN